MITAAADHLERVLEHLFPRGVVTAGGSPESAVGTLFPEETACVADAVPKRQREFRAGRLYARAALSQLGVPNRPLVTRADRQAAWPPGIVGTISHTDGCCGIAVARTSTAAGLGLDIEVVDAVTPDVAPAILTPGERRWLATRPDRQRWTAVVFSAKEAVYKSLWGIAPRFLGFHDAEIDVDAAAGRFTARLLHPGDAEVRGGEPLHGRFCVWDRWVLAGVTLP